MTFSKKIFISFFISTLIIGTGLILTGHYIVSEKVRSRFVKRYENLTSILADTLLRLDKNTEVMMKNAAMVVAAHESMKGVLSETELKKLRDDLGVTHLFIINKDGKFIRSTNEDVHLIPNLFSFSEDYKKLITGESTIDATPVIKPDPEPSPFKFLLIPSNDKQRIIEVGVRVDFIANTLQAALKQDKNIQSLSLYAPDGTTLGQFASDTVNLELVKTDIAHLNKNLEETSESFKMFHKVTSSQPDCSQCKVSGTTKNGEYYYIVESNISKAQLIAARSITRNIFISLGFLNIVFAFMLSKLLSKKLVRNIEEATTRVKAITENKEKYSRVDLKGTDEISYLTNEFDKLLNEIDESQKKVLEAEKDKAKVQLAQEVAHNIKSPLVALEMIMPLMTQVPDNLKKIQKNALAEIKELSNRLQEKEINLLNSASSLEDVNLVEVVEEVVEQKKIESASKNIEFKLKKDFIEDPVTKANRLEIRGIISNILNNSIEAVRDKQGEVEISIKESESTSYVEIKDNGKGIPKSVLQNLGTRKVTTKTGKGMGIGVFSAFQKIKNWGGVVKIESEVNKGTRVSVEF